MPQPSPPHHSRSPALDVPEDLMAELIANVLRDLVASRVDNFAGLALEQVRAWEQPICCSGSISRSEAIRQPSAHATTPRAGT